MPRSIFLGRAQAPGEPLWTEDDIDAALAYMDYLDSLCPGCGHSRHESFDPENFMAYSTEALRCHACADRDATQRARSNDENATTDGMYFVVERKGD